MKKKHLLPAVLAGIAWSTAGLFVNGLVSSFDRAGTSGSIVI